MIIHKATAADRYGIALLLVQAFEKELAAMRKKPEVLAQALEGGIRHEQFYVMDQDGQLAGIIGLSDGQRRAVQIDAAQCKKHLGWLIGTMAAPILQREMSAPISVPPGATYIDIVATSEDFRRQGVATRLLCDVFNALGNPPFALDVTNVNLAAQACYQKLGFVEYKRIPCTHPRMMGFKEKIYMLRPAG